MWCGLFVKKFDSRAGHAQPVRMNHMTISRDRRFKDVRGLRVEFYG